MQLDRFFSQQKSKISEDSSFQEKVFIQFDVKGTLYAVDIEKTREVIEDKAITPYPQRRPGHLGVIALRGQVMPVLDLNGDNTISQEERENEFKILVLELEENFPFCLRVKKVKRVVVEIAQLDNPILNIDQNPVCHLELSNFESLWRREAS